MTEIGAFIHAQTEDTTPAVGDEVLTYDLTASGVKRVKLSNLVSGGSSYVGVRYQTDAAQNIVSGAAVAIIDFEDQIYDSGTLVTTGTSWKFTAPVSGLYHVDCHLMLASTAGWAVDKRTNLCLYRDNTFYAMLDYQDGKSGTIFMSTQGSTTLYIAATSYIDIRFAQNHGSDILLTNTPEQNWISISKIG